MKKSDNYSAIIDLIRASNFNEAEKKIDAIKSSKLKIYLTGLLKYQKKEFPEAEKLLRNSIENFPENLEIKRTYALLLHRLARYNEALKLYKEILELMPNDAGLLNSIGVIENLYGDNITASKTFQKAINCSEKYLEPYLNLGNVKKDSGEIEESIKCYEKALLLDPNNYYAISNIMLAKCYTATDSEELMNTYKKFDYTLNNSSNSKFNIKTEVNSKIRVGYLSGDFKQHSVLYFFEPIIANHNLEKFKIFCYSDVPNPDPATIRLSGYPVTWKNIYGVADDDVAKIMADDNINILVDLAGHANNKRIAMLSKRVAPIQITYCGFPFSTGLSNMDYRITDTTVDPAGEDKFYTEELIRMEPPFLCYRPPKDAPDLSELPALSNNYITLGSFNNIAKIQNETLNLWSKILKKIPNSKLFLKNKFFNRQEQQDIFIERCKLFNIDQNRLIFSEYSPSLKSHLEQYNRVDIALDTFPYNGTTTTCEAFWMGVPVVSLTGTTHHSRVGKTLLQSVGLSELSCNTASEFTEKVRYLSENINILASLRKNLRFAVANSDLCNASVFTKRLESIYTEVVTPKRHKI